MRLKCLAFMILASAALSARAAPMHYEFEYKGGWYQSSLNSAPRWVPEATWGGYFRGEDVNGDNTIDNTEISEFVSYNFSGPRCAGEYSSCGASFQQYVIGGNVEYHGYYSYILPGWEYYTIEQWNIPVGATIEHEYPVTESWWFDGTVLTVEVSAVPEPSAWLMLGTGLLAAGIAARRRT
ncbi:PEP-CTERM sorting domain-containing protein [Pseudoduganella sp. SL102]|uniref:PEP-CTERM sorting domain-containing protein n=1 Tax=Pseudoduganella sp. SL102 TaxID=2995154 RepID=UPI00248B3B3A|nr:PEP-CTERM sorting domain-containing protein [Pseudoduganella sp. SL102]WBS04442.1 PEP-CTERM sorting domain-containing protein [Pseudoduganella sp. SL102]